MTEAEWLVCTDPTPMLEFLRSKTSERKCRLFLVACARQAWSSISDEQCRKGVETAERYADGLVSDNELGKIYSVIFQTFTDRHTEWMIFQSDLPSLPRKQVMFSEVLAWGHSVCTTSLTKPGFDGLLSRNAWVHYGSQLTKDVQPRLIREIIGNPFRFVALDPVILAWNDGTVPKMAQRIYEDRNFADMPILADALEDAGCDNADILRHCREPGQHVRGCWVVDLLLGKS